MAQQTLVGFDIVHSAELFLQIITDEQKLYGAALIFTLILIMGFFGLWDDDDDDDDEKKRKEDFEVHRKNFKLPGQLSEADIEYIDSMIERCGSDLSNEITNVVQPPQLDLNLQSNKLYDLTIK